MDDTNKAPDPSTVFVVTERMHAACAAYDAALGHVHDQKLKGQLQTFADENHQHLALLQRHVEGQIDASALRKTASDAAVHVAAWLQAKQVQLGQLLGAQDLFLALAERERDVVEAYDALCRKDALDEQLRRMAQDQLQSAKLRQRWLMDPAHAAKARAAADDHADVTDEGRRDVRINTPKQASSENSDC